MPVSEPRSRERTIASAQAVEPRLMLAAADLLLDINTYTADSRPFDFTAGPAAVAYFTAQAPGSGRELYKTDGTAAGTSLVKDIRPGSESSMPSPDNQLRLPPDFTVVGNLTYFVADDGTTGAELWRTDGTAVGTLRVKDIYPAAGPSQPKNLTAVGNILYFVAQANDG